MARNGPEWQPEWHEALFHSLANKWDIQGSDRNEDVDGGGGFGSTKFFEKDAEFSDKACNAICDKLDIRTGK